MSEEKKFDPFKPATPQIPGVAPVAPTAEAAPAEPGILPAGAKVEEEKKQIPMWVWPVAGVAGILLLVIAYFLLRPAETLEEALQASDSAPAPSTPGSPAPSPSFGAMPIAPDEDVATVQEMSKPWSTKKFLFSRSGGGTESALLVRLPSGSPHNSTGYWAFAARAAFGKCDMELIEDASRIRSDFNYRASRPMVVDTCEKVVYDPLSYGYVRGVMIRGEVVQGAGFRPPIAIEVRVVGDRIQAVRIEQ
jgi:hypothetical protein